MVRTDKFLFSPNRLKVAVPRVRGLVYLAATEIGVAQGAK
jgi:hypothetical protein